MGRSPVTAMVMVGAALRSMPLTVGSQAPGGSSWSIRSSTERISWMAASTSVSISSWRMARAASGTATVRMRVTLLTRPRASSTGTRMDASTSSGLAPGYTMVTIT